MKSLEVNNRAKPHCIVFNCNTKVLGFIQKDADKWYKIENKLRILKQEQIIILTDLRTFEKEVELTFTATDQLIDTTSGGYVA